MATIREHHRVRDRLSEGGPTTYLELFFELVMTSRTIVLELDQVGSGMSVTLADTVSASAEHQALTTRLAQLVREHGRSSAFGGAFAGMRDSAALGELFKTVTAGMAIPSALNRLMEEVAGIRTPSSRHSEVELGEVPAASPIVHLGQEEAPSPTVGVRGAEIYAALVVLIVLALLAACWLHEADRVGRDFSEVNRFELLQSGEWAVQRSLLVGALVLACLRRRNQE